MATRGDILDRVTDLLEDKSTTTRTRLEPWVGFVLSEMKQAGVLGPDATATVSVVSGTATYNLPTDLDTLDSVYIEDDAGEPLVFQPEWLFAKHLADDDDLTGIPEWFTLPKRNVLTDQGTIRLYPIPNSTETLRVNYKANFATLSNDSDILALTDDVMTTAVWGVYRIWTRLEENDDILAASQEFRLSLAAAKKKQYGSVARIYRVQYEDI